MSFEDPGRVWVGVDDLKKPPSAQTGDQHVYHHSDAAAPRISVKAERNSKGVNYEATVSGASTPDEALRLLKETMDLLRREYAR